MTDYDKISREFIKIIDKYKLGAKELRYLFKKVRSGTGLYVQNRKQSLPKWLSPAEIYHFLETAQNIEPRYRLFADILFQTGLRISELKNLDIRDINTSENILKVINGKGSKDRIIPIGNNLIQQINLFVGGRKAGQIFLKSNNKPYSVRRLQQWFSEISVKAGFGVLNPHVARHSYAVLLRSKGILLQDIQMYLGHNDIKTTQIYAKISFTPDQKQKYLQLWG